MCVVDAAPAVAERCLNCACLRRALCSRAQTMAAQTTHAWAQIHTSSNGTISAMDDQRIGEGEETERKKQLGAPSNCPLLLTSAPVSLFVRIRHSLYPNQAWCHGSLPGSKCSSHAGLPHRTGQIFDVPICIWRVFVHHT